MFEQQQSAPWYRSITGVIATSLLLPPVGLALLWTRPQTPVRRKILFSLCIFLIGVGYFSLFSAWRRSSSNEVHYAALAQHRAQQQREALKPGTRAGCTHSALLENYVVFMRSQVRLVGERTFSATIKHKPCSGQWLSHRLSSMTKSSCFLADPPASRSLLITR